MKNLNNTKINKVNEVFNAVFNKYDFMNDLMSFGAHRVWKKKMIDWLNPTNETTFIDMSSGTGDIAKEYLKRTEFKSKITCIDPNINMINIGKKRLKEFQNIEWICSTAEKLPLKSETFDIYAVSFGIRNFENINQSLKEAWRVLKPGGRFICLEFSKVENEILDKIYKTYSKAIPLIGNYVIGSREPYEYLIESIKNFVNQEELIEILKSNKFYKPNYKNLSGGIVSIHSGWKI